MVRQNTTGAEAPEVSILLVNWNTRDMTLECLRSLYAETTRTSFEVILVDNASSDGSAEAIAREFPQIILMAEGKNHGFGRATNLQAARARGNKLLLLNTDTVVLDHAIDALAEFSRRTPGARIWGGKTLFGDGSLNPTSCWGRPSPWAQFCLACGLTALFPRSKLFNPRAYPDWDHASDREVEIVTGCLLMIDADFWRELGGFDPAFFMYGEETDLCLRAGKMGAKPMVTPAATIIHYGGGSSASRAEKIVQLMACEISLSERHDGRLASRFTRAAVRFRVAVRAAGYSLAALLKPHSYRGPAHEWSEAWARRGEWQRGWQVP